MGETFEYIDLKHVKLKGRPISEWMLFYEPTERLMLWIINNCKEAFNPKHFLKYTKQKMSENPNDHKLKKHLELLQNLKAKGFIEQDQEGNYHVTTKGQLYRLTSHPQWILIQVGVPIITAILIAVFVNWKKSTVGEPKEAATRQSTQISDSVSISNQPVLDSHKNDSSGKMKKDSSP